MSHRLPLLVLVLLGSWSLPSCTRRHLPAAHIVERPAPTPGHLTVHLRGGELIVLTQWTDEDDPPLLVGSGTLYDARRQLVRADTFSIPVDSIALLETTVSEPQELLIGEGIGGTALAVFTALTGTLTIACLADPKSCFGSCPTFYDDPDADRPVAEAFSGSVVRVLEQRDIDALPSVRLSNGSVRLRMRNEALETHAIRQVRLLAAPRGTAGVSATPDNRFFQLESVVEPIACTAADGDCLDAIRRRDGVERRSWTDSTDLAARELIELEFPAAEGPLGLVISARHTFVSTFVFYQMMAYLGEDAGEALAAIERGQSLLRGAFERGVGILGDVDVLVARPRGWVRVATFGEAGPLASDVQVVPLGEVEGAVRLRLELTRGYWRIDMVALARLGPAVDAVPVEVARIERDGFPDERALGLLRDAERYLVTYPGDAYDLVFDVPAHVRDAALFLDATGYYYEWMRREWLEERNPAMLTLLVLRPRTLFRRLAPEFKASEARMEELFWASRFGGRR